MADPTKNVQLTTLIKLGSIAVHALEFTSKEGHHFDKIALDSLLNDPEVKQWLEQMDKLAFLPKMRKRKK